MTITHAVFLHYILLILVLLLGLALFRSVLGLSGKVKNLRFAPDGSDVSEFGYRLTRAHMNAVECFPFIGGLLLYAIVTEQTALTNGLAMTLLLARIAQTVILLVSVSRIAIQARFAAFLVQFAICLYWLWLFIQPLMQ